MNRVTINDKHGLRLGLQGYLLQSLDNNDDSLSALFFVCPIASCDHQVHAPRPDDTP